MDWSQVKGLTIPEGEVVGVSVDGETLWQKPVTGRNLLDPATVESLYVSSKNGVPVESSTASPNWRHSDYIPVTGGVTYYFGQTTYSTATTAGTAWYDSSKRYVSGSNATALKNAGGKLKAPASAAYLRHSWSTIDNPNWETTVYICVDGDLDHWVPYVG